MREGWRVRRSSSAVGDALGVFQGMCGVRVGGGVGRVASGVRVGLGVGRRSVRVGEGYGSTRVGVRVGGLVGRGRRVREGLGVNVALPLGVAEGTRVGLAPPGVRVGTRVRETILGVIVRRAGCIPGVKDGLGKGFGSSVALGCGVGAAAPCSGDVVGLGLAAVRLGSAVMVGLVSAAGVTGLGGTTLTRCALKRPPAARPSTATTVPGCGGVAPQVSGAICTSTPPTDHPPSAVASRGPWNSTSASRPNRSTC